MKALKTVEIQVATKGLTKKISVVQSDSGRSIDFIVSDMTMPTGTTARIYAVKPDSTEAFIDCTISDNIITANLTTGLLAAVGVAKCQLNIISGSDVVTTFEFALDINKSLISDSSMESSNEFSALTDALVKVDGLQGSINNPIFVTTTDEMTDTTKFYVLTTNGQIYFWDGTQFASSGIIYGATGLEYAYRGTLSLLGLTTITLTDYQENGYYFSGSTAGYSITDFPSKFAKSGFILSNEKSAVNGEICQKLTNLQQGIAIRYIYSSGTASDWIYLHTSADFRYLGQLNAISTTITLSDHAENGWYLSGGTGSMTITDYPSEFVKNGFFLENISSPIDGSGNVLQKLTNVGTRQGTAIRYINSGNVGDWMYIRETSGFSRYLGTLPHNTDILLSGYTQQGYYYSGSATGLQILDYPTSQIDPHVVINSFRDDSNGVQMLLDIQKNALWFRFLSSTGAVTIDWQPLSSNSPSSAKWYAFGDSITNGQYSYVGTDGVTASAVNRAYSYINLANKWGIKKDLYNVAQGGTGFCSYNSAGTQTGLDILDATVIEDAEFITIGYGTNDWRRNYTLGDENSAAKDGTISGNCRYMIEECLRRAPEAKLVMITPINNIYSDSSGATSFSTRWALDFTRNSSKTLLDVRDIIIYWCKYYGIEWVDFTENNSCVNLSNIETVLPDGTHPSIRCFEQMGRSIVSRLNYV